MPDKITLTPEARNRIALAICGEILESEREKERLRERWIRLRAIHDVEESTSQVQLIEGMKPYMLPLSRAKADRIVGAVVDGITGINPYVETVDAGNSNSNLDAISADLMVLADAAGDDEALRQGTEDAWITNTGVWRVRPLIDERNDSPNSGDAKVTRLDWEAIDPIDVCCYPPYYGTFAAAKTVGHRWSELVYRVKADMKAGRYETYDLKGGDDPMRAHRTNDDIAEEYTAQTPSDQFVELWNVISEIDLKDDGNYERYICVVALSEQKLLSIQKYPYSTPWYIEVRTESVRKRIFPSSSVAQRLQGMQLAYSDGFTAMVQSSWATIGPTTILTGGGLMEKVRQAKPFMVIETPADVKVQTITANPQVGALPQALEKIEEVADALTGISRSGTGQQINGATATEIDALQNAENQAKDQYTQIVAASVERVFYLMLEYYRVHYDQLKEAFGERLTADPAVVKTLHPTLKVNGRNGSSNSMIIIQKLQMLLGMIMQTPNSPYDPEKIIDQVAQALDLPFSLDRLKKDPNPIAELLKLPQIQELLMNGEPLPQLLQEIQSRANGQTPIQGQQPSGQGLLPGQPPMGPDGGGPGGPVSGATPPMLDNGGGNGGPQVPGAMPGA